MLRKITSILTAILLAGCASKPELTLYHAIEVPKEYQYGGGSPHGTSPYERYLSAYERNFWSCVENRTENIEYQYSLGDLAGCGWPSAIDGYHDGYLKAEEIINGLVENFGKDKTQEFLINKTGFGL